MPAELSAESCLTTNAETPLDGLVLLTVLLRRPDEEPEHEEDREQDEDRNQDRGSCIHCDHDCRCEV